MRWWMRWYRVDEVEHKLIEDKGPRVGRGDSTQDPGTGDSWGNTPYSTRSSGNGGGGDFLRRDFAGD